MYRVSGNKKRIEKRRVDQQNPGKWTCHSPGAREQSSSITRHQVRTHKSQCFSPLFGARQRNRETSLRICTVAHPPGKGRELGRRQRPIEFLTSQSQRPSSSLVSLAFPRTVERKTTSERSGFGCYGPIDKKVAFFSVFLFLQKGFSIAATSSR